MQINFLRVSGVCGFLTPVIALVCILAAISYYPEFNWIENALSDLGVIAGPAASFFNYGLIISGLLCFVFSIGVFQYFERIQIGRLGSILLFFASFSLVLIGLFPEDVKPIHYIVSLSFFALLPASMFLSALFFWLQKKKLMALFTSFSATAAATPWILHFFIKYVAGVAIPEALSAIFGSFWIMVLSFKMFRLSSN